MLLLVSTAFYLQYKYFTEKILLLEKRIDIEFENNSALLREMNSDAAQYHAETIAVREDFKQFLYETNNSRFIRDSENASQLP